MVVHQHNRNGARLLANISYLPTVIVALKTVDDVNGAGAQWAV